jgi:peptide/nickel transport system substrate-binding protein
VNVIYWQAPSILNPYLSGGTKDVEAPRWSSSRWPASTRTACWSRAWRPRSHRGKRRRVRGPDQITWKLKPGLLWSDGTPVTSADVVSPGILHPPRRRLRAGGAKYEGITSVEAPTT